MKTIGFVSETLHSGGGLELFELEIAERLAQRGWKMAVAYQNDGDLVPRWEQFATVKQQSFSTADAEAAIAHLLEDSDIIYAHRPGDYSRAYSVSRKVNAPVMMHLHLPPRHLRNGWKRFLLGSHNQPMNPEVFSRNSKVDKFLAVSNYTASIWTKSGIPKQKIEVVYNGVNTDHYCPGTFEEKTQIRQELGIQPDTIVVGYVGRIDKLKGIHQLLDAFNMVYSKTARSLTLLVIGEATRSLGDQGIKLTTELKQKARGDVRWLGKRRDLSRLYRTMDVLVTPSQWDEPFGLVAVEGLSSQLPVIATKTGGLQEVLAGALDDNLVDKTPVAIAARLLQLVEDPMLRESLGIKGRHLAQERFDIERTVDKIENQLSNLLKFQLQTA